MQIGKVVDWVDPNQKPLVLQNLTLKPLQIAIINCSYQHDVIVNLPTGYGKSLLFQYPASKLNDQCIVLFVPLRALLWDCIKQASKFGIFMAQAQAQSISQYQKTGILPQIFVLTPQKLFLNSLVRHFIQQLHQSGKIIMFVVDEAHCISDWGADFRPHYLTLSDLKIMFPRVKIMALSATIPPQAREDLANKLLIPNCYYFQSSLNRANLIYSAEICQKNIIHERIMDFLSLKGILQAQGLIYCQTIKMATQISVKLHQIGLKCSLFHSKISEKKRLQTFQNFMSGKIKALVATICFGMGINKRDIRYVIHAGIAGSVQAYYQQSGRAGRDGFTSYCHLISFQSDDNALVFLTTQSEMNQNAKRRKLAKIELMKRYPKKTDQCRKTLLFYHLGEAFPACQTTCDICLNQVPIQQYKSINGTQICRKIIIEIQNSYKVYFTSIQLIAFLAGSANASKKLKKMPQSIKGLFKNESPVVREAYVNALIDHGLLVRRKVKCSRFQPKYYEACTKAELRNHSEIIIKIPDKPQKTELKRESIFGKYLANKKESQTTKSIIEQKPIDFDLQEGNLLTKTSNYEFLEELFGSESNSEISEGDAKYGESFQTNDFEIDSHFPNSENSEVQDVEQQNCKSKQLNSNAVLLTSNPVKRSNYSAYEKRFITNSSKIANQLATTTSSLAVEANQISQNQNEIKKNNIFIDKKSNINHRLNAFVNISAQKSKIIKSFSNQKQANTKPVKDQQNSSGDKQFSLWSNLNQRKKSKNNLAAYSDLFK